MRTWGVALALGLLSVSDAAAGQALLKVQGSAFAPIRQKSMALNAQIEGPIATTTLNLIYFNPAHAQTEADFVFTVPEGAVVTGFAYWYKREKVVARIVDKERASVIYNAIKSFRRDPALVELVGKRTFRARIFPVEQRSDLKIEMTIVSTSRDGSFEFPVKVAKDQPIDTASISVAGRPGSGVTSCVNSFGAPSTFTDGVYSLKIEASKWRPEKNLRVSFKREGAGLGVQTAVARSSADSGYFAMVVSAPREVKYPKVVLSGVRTLDVHTGSRPMLGRGQSLLVTGRFSAPGRAKVRLLGRGTEDSMWVDLRAPSALSPAAVKLWAVDEIESLGKAPAHESRVRALSKQFLLPSPYTSWLAIPESERQRFELDIRAANAVIMATRFAESMKSGASRKSVEARLLAKISREPKDVQNRALSVIENAAYEILSRLQSKVSCAWEGRIAAGKGPGKLEDAELERVQVKARLLGFKGQDWRVTAPSLQNKVADLYRGVASENVKEPAARREAGRLRAWYALAETAGQWPYVVSWATAGDAREYQRDVLAHGQASEYGTTMKAKVERGTDWLSGDRRNMFGSQMDYEADGVARQLARLQLDGRGKSDEAQAIQKRLTGFAKTFPWFNAESKVKTLFAYEARTRQIGMIPALGRAVRRTGISDAQTRAMLDEAERYRALAGGGSYIGEQGTYEWTQPALDLVDEARSRLLAGEPVADVRDGVGQQKARLAEAKFTKMLAEVDKQLKYQLDREAYGIAGQLWRANPDDAAVREHERSLRCFAELLHVDPEPYLKKAEGPLFGDDKRWKFLTELRKPEPDPGQVAALREDFRDDNPDWRGQEWISWRIERIETDVMLDKLEKAAMTPELERQVAELRRKSEELHARMGDPTIAIKLPPGTAKAEARFPWGGSTPLLPDPADGLWKAKFDVPLDAGAGTKVVKVVSVGGDGKLVESAWTFVVDLSAPELSVRSDWHQGVLRVVLTGPLDLARAKAVVPWSAPVPMTKTADGKFEVELSPPSGWNGEGAFVVAFDKAHNRTEASLRVPRRP